MKCLSRNEIEEVLKEVHARILEVIWEEEGCLNNLSS